MKFFGGGFSSGGRIVWALSRCCRFLCWSRICRWFVCFGLTVISYYLVTFSSSLSWSVGFWSCSFACIGLYQWSVSNGAYTSRQGTYQAQLEEPLPRHALQPLAYRLSFHQRELLALALVPVEIRRDLVVV